MSAQLLLEQNKLESAIQDLDNRIYALETTYFESTPEIGNIVHGWCTNPTAMNARDQKKEKVKKVIHDEDRIFSNSSATALKVLATTTLLTVVASTRSFEKESKILIKKKEVAWVYTIYILFLRARGRQSSPHDSMCQVLLIKVPKMSP